MTPPICKLCNKDFYHGAGYSQGGLVYFSNYKDLSPSAAGKPQGCDWYCVEHYDAAVLRNHLTDSEAYLVLKAEFPNLIMHDWRERFNPELWITDIGINKAKVILYIRQIIQITSVNLKEKLSNKELKVIDGWLTQINPHKEKLEALGAKVEIRFP